MSYVKINCNIKMRNIFKALVLSIILLMTSCGGVYVCTGPTATRYHKSSTCNGLSRCSGSINKISVEEAESEGRTPCKICY